MFQCKAYLNTCLVWITILVRLLVEVDMFSVFPITDLKKKTIFFDSKCHDSYLLKCLHNNISQNDKLYGDTGLTTSSFERWNYI